MIKHIIAWLVVLAAIVGITSGLVIYKSNEFKAAQAAASLAPEPSEAVVTVRARTGEISATTRAIGTVVALRQLEVRNELAGTIAEMGFTSGSVVEKDQLLVQLDVRQEAATLAAVEAEAKLAKQTLDRRLNLKGSPAFSEQEVDRSRSEYAASSARASALAAIMQKKRITAPFRARVGITNLQPGAYLDTGTLIARLQGLDADAYIDFSLPQDSAAAIHPGTSVGLSGNGIAEGTTAIIVAEDDSIDGTSRAVRFRATAKGLGASLRPGTFVDVSAVVSAPRKTVMVPLTAVRRSPGGQHVFVIVEENGKLRARQRLVETGPVQNDDIAVEKGLAEGELIAAAGSFKLRDGLLVATDAPAASASAPGVN